MDQKSIFEYFLVQKSLDRKSTPTYAIRRWVKQPLSLYALKSFQKSKTIKSNSKIRSKSLSYQWWSSSAQRLAGFVNVLQKHWFSNKTITMIILKLQPLVTGFVNMKSKQKVTFRRQIIVLLDFNPCGVPGCEFAFTQF